MTASSVITRGFDTGTSYLVITRGFEGAAPAKPFYGINAALNQKLQAYAVANSIDVAYENIDYGPTTGAMYLRASVLPDITRRAEMGGDGQRGHSGTFMIDVVAPVDDPKATALEEADQVADYFARGTTLTYGIVNVRTGTASIGAAVREGSWYVIPVFIKYLSFTEPRV